MVTLIIYCSEENTEDTSKMVVLLLSIMKALKFKSAGTVGAKFLTIQESCPVLICLGLTSVILEALRNQMQLILRLTICSVDKNLLQLLLRSQTVDVLEILPV